MGIPHLYTHLRPYACPESFTDGQNRPLYIDGPGLAYHVYYLAFCATPLSSACNPWESAVEYQDLATAVISFLDCLQERGFSVEKIYFDGHLPASKTTTRLSRLTDSLKKLSTYHTLHPTSLPAAKSRQLVAAENPFSYSAKFEPRSSQLSPPPFIVMACLEKIHAHPVYASTVETVPGEADGFCARDAIHSGGLVLTGDSDLLLFEPSPNEKAVEWGVIMFKDLQFMFSDSPSGVFVAKALVFRPVSIARITGVHLKTFAWESMQDPHATFGQLKERVSRIAQRRKTGARIENTGKHWNEFLENYLLPPPPSVGEDGDKKVLDSRIAEILFQHPNFRESVHPPVPLVKRGEDENQINIFLPFLWEETSRTSAWDVGVRIRTLAYSLLFTAHPQKKIVNEYSRHGTRISSLPVKLLTTRSEIDQEIALLFPTSLPSPSPPPPSPPPPPPPPPPSPSDWWTPLLLTEIITTTTPNHPSQKELEAISYSLSTSSSPSPPLSPPQARETWEWKSAHLFAQIQAGVYSLMILKKLLPFSTTPTTDYARLGKLLSELPGIEELVSGRRMLEGYLRAGEREKGFVERVLESIGGVKLKGVATQEGKSGKTKKSKKRLEKVRVGGGGRGNAFMALEGIA